MSDPGKEPMKRLLPLLGSLAVVVGLYVGLYYATVERERPRRINGNGILFETKYSFGGEWTRELFEPINKIDREIRPEFWFERFDLTALFVD